MNLKARSKVKPNGALYLVIAIPCAAILMGVISLYIAFSQPDPGVQPDGVPMSKTSWREQR
jgi:hypothetical protein